MIKCMKCEDCKNWEFEWNETPCVQCVHNRNLDPVENHYEPIEPIKSPDFIGMFGEVAGKELLKTWDKLSLKESEGK